MITVINAGGSGTRLWPLSTPKRPKQLLALTGERSLVQQSYDRVKDISDKVYILTEVSHAEEVKKQLPELEDDAFIVEPGRRGTAHCFLMALDYIARNHPGSESVIFIHSDHNVRDKEGFQQSIKSGVRASQAEGVVSLVGIEPTYPATCFEYIERGKPLQSDSSVSEVVSFRERGEYSKMLEYVEAGNFLWNCGYFIATVDVFLSQMKNFVPDFYQKYEKLAAENTWNSASYQQEYLHLDVDMIDFALIKRLPKLVVAAARFDWMDIGGFKDLHDILPKDAEGNYVKGDNIHALEVENAYIRNEEPGKPVAVIGLDNIVVVNTPDGILVARKDVAAKCGDIAKTLQ